MPKFKRIPLCDINRLFDAASDNAVAMHDLADIIDRGDVNPDRLAEKIVVLNRVIHGASELTASIAQILLRDEMESEKAKVREKLMGFREWGLAGQGNGT